MKTPVRALLLVALGMGACAPSEEVELHDDDEVGDSIPLDGKADSVGVTVPGSLHLDKHKIVYLTFDDGPSRANTPVILDVLRKHSAKATFFITGTSIAGNEDLIRRERDEGHIVGSHQWQHVIATQAQFQGFVTRERDALRAILGDDHKLLFRFPYGAGATWKNTILRAQGYIDGGIGWDVDSLDWDFGPDERAARAPTAWKTDFEGWVLHEVNRVGGGVILMHDIQSIESKHLDSVLTKLEAAGYTFGELPRQRDWIGDECSDDDECAFAGGFCLNGLCTQSCTGSCPDAWGRPTTRCARLSDHDSPGQIQVCAADCTTGTSCRAGECVASTSPGGAARQVCWD